LELGPPTAVALIAHSALTRAIWALLPQLAGGGSAQVANRQHPIARSIMPENHVNLASLYLRWSGRWGGQSWGWSKSRDLHLQSCCAVAVGIGAGNGNASVCRAAVSVLKSLSESATLSRWLDVETVRAKRWFGGESPGHPARRSSWR
jgi:hypothetical protein